VLILEAICAGQTPPPPRRTSRRLFTLHRATVIVLIFLLGQLGLIKHDRVLFPLRNRYQNSKNNNGNSCSIFLRENGEVCDDNSKMYSIGEVKQRRVRSTFGWVAAGNTPSTGHYLYIFVIIQKLLTKNMIRTDVHLLSGPRRQMLERPYELGS
jgi:hypothetical protein